MPAPYAAADVAKDHSRHRCAISLARVVHSGVGGHAYGRNVQIQVRAAEKHSEMVRRQFALSKVVDGQYAYSLLDPLIQAAKRMRVPPSILAKFAKHGLGQARLVCRSVRTRNSLVHRNLKIVFNPHEAFINS